MTDDILDSFLRCGLYMGAIFQVVCIAAAVCIPEKAIDPIATIKVYIYTRNKFYFIKIISK